MAAPWVRGPVPDGGWGWSRLLSSAGARELAQPRRRARADLDAVQERDHVVDGPARRGGVLDRDLAVGLARPGCDGDVRGVAARVDEERPAVPVDPLPGRRVLVVADHQLARERQRLLVREADWRDRHHLGPVALDLPPLRDRREGVRPGRQAGALGSPGGADRGARRRLARDLAVAGPVLGGVATVGEPDQPDTDHARGGDAGEPEGAPAASRARQRALGPGQVGVRVEGRGDRAGGPLQEGVEVVHVGSLLVDTVISGSRTERSRSRALAFWDFTVPVVQPRIRAVSATSRSRKCRSTTTARCRGASWARAASTSAGSSRSSSGADRSVTTSVVSSRRL